MILYFLENTGEGFVEKRLGIEQLVEFSALVQRGQIIKTTDVIIVDKNLWNGTTAGNLHHVIKLDRVFIHFDQFVLCFFTLQQTLGGRAIAAETPTINYNFWL